MRATLAALLALTCTSAAAETHCAVDAAELHRLLSIELGELGDTAPRVRLRCHGDRVELTVHDAHRSARRSLDLAPAPARARARLIALAAAELSHLAADAPPTPQQTVWETNMFRSILATGLVSALVAGAAPALPAPPPKPDHDVTAPQTRWTRPPPPPRDERTAPSLRADDLLSVGARVAAVTASQIGMLERLLASTADGDPDKAELWFQLGELHAEAQRWHTLRARELDARLYDARRRNDARAAAALTAEQDQLQHRAHQSRLAAARAYLEVADHADRYPRYAKTDEVLYYLAHLLGEAERQDAALVYFKRLIKDHPTSRFIPDAYLSFGEYHFDHHNLADAAAFYDRVLQFPQSRLYAYALYKKGWCHFNQGDFKAALDAFVRVVQSSPNTPSRIALDREARRDLVRTYAHVGAAEHAWPFFQRVAAAAAPAMLEQLAELYQSEGKSNESIRLYRQLMAMAPTSPRLCAWQTEVVRGTLQLTGSRADPTTVAELRRLAAFYDRTPSDGECRDATSHTLRELAAVWHKEGQSTAQLRTLDLADALYREYLARFAGETDAYTMTFYRAELLYRLAANDSKHYCTAAPLYDEVVRRRPDRAAPHLADAAWAAVLSWRGCLGLDDEPALAASADTRRAGPPRPIPEPWRRMLATFDRYLTYLPDSPQAPIIQYRKARVYYIFDHITEAIPLFAALARRHDSELSVYAADLLFDCHALLAQVDALTAAVAELCVPPLTGDPGNTAFRGRCAHIRCALDRQTAESLERAGHPRDAAEHYLAVVNSCPDDPHLDELYFNAGICFQRARLIGPAVLTLQRLAALRPDSPLAKKAFYIVGRAYQEIAAFDAAADNYEQFARRWPGEHDAPPALFRAAFFRGGLGDAARARDDAQLFLRNYRGRNEWADVAAAVAFGQAQGLDRDPARLQRHYSEYLQQWKSAGGLDRQIVALVRRGEAAWRAACPVPLVLGACIDVQRTPRRRTTLAHITTCAGGPTITVHARKTSLVRAAQADFAEALRLYQDGAALHHVGRADDPEHAARVDLLRHHAAWARMLQGDAELERFLALAVPAQLDFRRPAAKTRFRAWLDGKSRQLEVARKVYQGVIGFHDAHWAIASAARIGQLFQAFAAQLDTTPIPPPAPAPPGVPAGQWHDDFTTAYCDAFGEQVTPLEDKAVEAYDACLSKSTELSWFNEWSGACEAELNQIDPHRYPLAAEVRAQPIYESAVLARAPLQR